MRSNRVGVALPQEHTQSPADGDPASKSARMRRLTNALFVAFKSRVRQRAEQEVPTAAHPLPETSS